MSETDTSATRPGLTREQLDLRNLEDGDGLVYKHQIEAAKTREQVRTYQIRNDKERGKLIKAETMKNFVSKWYSIETSEFHTLGDRLGPELASMLGVDDAGLVLEISKTVDKEVSKTLDHIERHAVEYLKSCQVSNGDG